MKPIRSYPIWLASFMLLGPFFMISGFSFRSQSMWVQIAGAGMIMIAMFYLSNRLHVLTEEVASLRQLRNGGDDAGRESPQD